MILLTGGSRIACHTLCPKGSFGAISCTVRDVNGTGVLPSAGNLRESWSWSLSSRAICREIGSAWGSRETVHERSDALFKAMAGILSLLDYILAAAAHTAADIAILQLPEAAQRRRPVLQTSTAARRADMTRHCHACFFVDAGKRRKESCAPTPQRWRWKPSSPLGLPIAGRRRLPRSRATRLVEGAGSWAFGCDDCGLRATGRWSLPLCQLKC